MALNTTAGSTISIGSAVPDPSVADETTLDVDTYTEVKRLMDLGEIGDAANDVPVSMISETRVRHLKGQFDGGQVTVIFARDWSDPGQQAMRAAFKADTDFAFKIERNGSGGKVSYFAAVVMGERESYSTADNVQQVTFTLGINSDVFTVEDAVTP